MSHLCGLATIKRPVNINKTKQGHHGNERTNGPTIHFKGGRSRGKKR